MLNSSLSVAEMFKLIVSEIRQSLSEISSISYKCISVLFQSVCSCALWLWRQCQLAINIHPQRNLPQPLTMDTFHQDQRAPRTRISHQKQLNRRPHHPTRIFHQLLKHKRVHHLR